MLYSKRFYDNQEKLTTTQTVRKLFTINYDDGIGVVCVMG